MMGLLNQRPQVYAEDVVAREYADLSWFRRMVLRWVSPDMAAAARHLSQTPRGYTNVPIVKANQPGVFTRMGDRLNS